MVNLLGQNSLLNTLKSSQMLRQAPDMFADVSPEKAAEFNPKEARDKGFVIFERTVTHHVELKLHVDFSGSKEIQLENKLQEMAPAEDSGRDERSDKAANTILGFIEMQLKRDKADGATEEELASRLEAALEGFEQGFSEAREILEGFNLLSPYVEDDINATYNKVTEGIQEFREKYLGEVAQADSVEAPPSDESAVESVKEASSVSGYASAAQLDMSQAREFSFQLRTQDGDLVTIHAAGNEAFSSQAVMSEATDGENRVSQYSESQSYTRGSTFSFSVEGELDEDELAAINKLLHGVNDLAGDFYSGDVEEAFQQAQELGYNTEEIAGFSLQISQSVSRRAAVAYQEQSGVEGRNNFSERLKPLADFVSQVQETFAPATEFAEPVSLFNGIIERIEAARAELLGLNEPDGRFSAFAKVILGVH